MAALGIGLGVGLTGVQNSSASIDVALPSYPSTLTPTPSAVAPSAYSSLQTTNSIAAIISKTPVISKSPSPSMVSPTASKTVAETPAMSKSPSPTKVSPTRSTSVSATTSISPSFTPSPSPACDIYVTDAGSPGVYKLPKFNAANKLSIGSGWSSPSGIFVNKTTLDVFVTDGANIYKVPGGTGTPFIVGSGFAGPRGVFEDHGNVYVADNAGGAVYVVPMGIGTPVAIGGSFSQPYNVFVTPSGDLWVTDFSAPAVYKIADYGAGTKTTYTDIDRISQPTGIWVAPNGDAYVAEYNNMALLKIAAGTTTVSTVLVSLSERPVSVTGTSWGEVFVGEHGSMGGIFAAGGSSISLGSWSNLQGLWADC